MRYGIGRCIAAIQLMGSGRANLDGRWWFGFKRFPSRRIFPDETSPWAWFLGFGPFQVRVWFRQRTRTRSGR